MNMVSMIFVMNTCSNEVFAADLSNIQTKKCHQSTCGPVVRATWSLRISFDWVLTHQSTAAVKCVASSFVGQILHVPEKFTPSRCDHIITKSLVVTDKSAGRKFSRGGLNLYFSSNMGVKSKKLGVSARLYGQNKKISPARGGAGPHPAYLCRRPCTVLNKLVIKHKASAIRSRMA